MDDSLNLRRKLAGERVGRCPLAAKYTDEIALAVKRILPRHLGRIGRGADQGPQPREILDLHPSEANVGEVVPENLQHVLTLVVATADRAAEGLAHFGSADEGLALPGQHKDDPTLARHFEKVRLGASPPENEVASPDEIELVGGADTAVFEQLLGPRAAYVQHAVVLSNAPVPECDSSVRCDSLNTALLVDLDPGLACLLRYPEPEGIVVHLAVRELVSTFEPLGTKSRVPAQQLCSRKPLRRGQDALPRQTIIEKQPNPHHPARPAAV